MGQVDDIQNQSMKHMEQLHYCARYPEQIALFALSTHMSHIQDLFCPTGAYAMEIVSRLAN
jgi:hypothetical protein